MIPETRISRELFAELMEPLYRQLITWRMTDEAKAAHILDHYNGGCRGFKPAVIEAAVRDTIASCSTMPTPSAFLAACGKARRKLSAEYFAEHPDKAAIRDSHECNCGCGGKRWAKWLPPSLEFPNIPRSRDFTICLKKKLNLPPKGPCYLDDRGVPLYGDPNYHGASNGQDQDEAHDPRHR